MEGGGRTAHRAREAEEARGVHRGGGAEARRASAGHDHRSGAGGNREAGNGFLTSSIVLVFDDDDVGEKTVDDVLDSPDEFAGLTLADPLEGPSAGRNKAVILIDAAGEPWIYSFSPLAE